MAYCVYLDFRSEAIETILNDPIPEPQRPVSLAFARFLRQLYFGAPGAISYEQFLRERASRDPRRVENSCFVGLNTIVTYLKKIQYETGADSIETVFTTDRHRQEMHRVFGSCQPYRRAMFVMANCDILERVGLVRSNLTLPHNPRALPH